MDILILTTRLSGGGAERVAAQLSNGLAREHDVSFCVFSREIGVSYDFSGDLFDLGIDLSASPLQKYPVLLNRLPELHRIKRSKNIDVTISLLSGPNFANLMTSTGDRRVISLRNCVSRRLVGYSGLLERALIRMLYPRADRAVCVSEGVQVDAVDHGFIDAQRAQTIMNPIDLEHVEHQSQEALPAGFESLLKRPTVINAGRFSLEKGHNHLLRVFAKVKRRRPESKLLLLGEGDRYADLLQEADELGLKTCELNDDPSAEHDVVFAGYRENPFKFYRAADVFALTSHWEGLPNVIIESMACGTPVISTDCRYGPRELLAPSTDVRMITDEPEESEFGMLMPEFEETSGDRSGSQPYDVWSETITRMLSDDELRGRYARAGRQRAADFDRERIFKQWLELLQSVTKQY